MVHAEHSRLDLIIQPENWERRVQSISTSPIELDPVLQSLPCDQQGTQSSNKPLVQPGGQQKRLPLSPFVSEVVSIHPQLFLFLFLSYFFPCSF